MRRARLDAAPRLLRTRSWVFVVAASLWLPQIAESSWPAEPAGDDDPRRTPIVKAIEKAGPAVVNISTETVVVQRYDPWQGLFEYLYRAPGEEDLLPGRTFRLTSLGSGVLIDPSGYIVTNEHVVSRASKILVTLHDGSEYEGRMVSSSPRDDLAAVKIDGPKPFPFVEMADSDDLLIGEPAIALGNPFGLENSAAVGVISAKNRTVSARGQVVFENLIQTDAPINQGNSGGPLINVHGQLIGINTAILAQAQNIGFALPVNRVKTVLGTLLDPRKVRRLWTGMVVAPLNEEASKRLGRGRDTAVVVEEVEPESPAAKEGILADDLIVSVDGKAVGSVLEYDRLLLPHKAGDTVTIGIRRGKDDRTVKLLLAEVPKPSGQRLAKERLGLQIVNLTAEMTRDLPIELHGGAAVTGVEPDSPAGRARIQKGDIIVQLGEYRVDNLDDMAALLTAVEPGSEVLIGFIRDHYRILKLITAR